MKYYIKKWLRWIIDNIHFNYIKLVEKQGLNGYTFFILNK